LLLIIIKINIDDNNNADDDNDNTADNELKLIDKTIYKLQSLLFIIIIITHDITILLNFEFLRLLVLLLIMNIIMG